MCHRIGFPPISTIGFGRTSLFAQPRAQAAGQNHCLHRNPPPRYLQSCFSIPRIAFLEEALLHNMKRLKCP